LKNHDSPGDRESSDEEGADGGESLLGSPLGQSMLNRLFVVGGPLGLAIAIALSLWVSYMHVRHTLVVQVETQWRAGEQLAVRAHLVAERPGPVTEARGRAWVEQGEHSHALGELKSAAGTAVLQTTFTVPELAAGPAELHLELEARGVEPMREVLPISVVTTREPREPVPMIAGSILQHGDDTDPQPQGMRIVVRPFGRILAGFDNTMMVRVTHADGRPYEGPIEVVLAGGELMGQRGSSDAPPSLFVGSTDRMGFVFLEGLLTSDVVRIEVRLLSRDDPPRVLHRRRMRMVSYAGAVVAEISKLAVELGATDEDARTLELHAHGLSAKLPVFVDVHGPDGAFVDALEPFSGRDVPRDWTLPVVGAGVVQIEAYHFTKDPGESTAIARLQVAQGLAARESLASLVAMHREQMHVARVENEFDRELERAHLDWLARAELEAHEVQTARSWLLGTLPITVYGPPTALVTHERDVEALTQKQRRWTIGLRFFLLGGGGLFLVAMTWAMVRVHGRAALTTMRELEQLTEGEARAEAMQHVRRARRAALARGLGVVAVMAAGLALTTIMLESLLWVF
jgi:hypothetical protein